MTKTIILIALSCIIVASTVHAVCLKGHLSIAEEYDNSQSVFIGKVVSETKVPESDNYYEGTNDTLQVQEVFKGNLNSTVVIFSENSSGRFPMSEGRTYIIFIYYGSHRYQIDNCGNSGSLPEKEDVVHIVQELKRNLK